MARRTLFLGGLLVISTALVAGTQLASARIAKPGPPPKATSTCNLGAHGKIKHVIYIQFDNVHFQRDNPNVPSDLEQMPNLLNFIKDNGTLDTNDHTDPDLAHGRRDPELADRASTPTGTARRSRTPTATSGPTARVGFSSSFKYWTDNTDGGNPANNPPTPSADPNYNMVNTDPAVARRHRRGPQRAGAVGAVHPRRLRRRQRRRSRTSCSRTTPRSSRGTPAPTTLAAAAAGRRDEHQGRQRQRASPAGQTLVLENGTANAELATIASVGTAGATGTGVDLTAPLTKAHATRRRR